MAFTDENGGDPYYDQFSSLPPLLAELRNQVGWSQIDLANRMGVDQSVISRIETGVTRKPTRATLERIAETFIGVGLNIDSRQLIQAVRRSLPSSPNNINARLASIHKQIAKYPPEVQNAFYSVVESILHLVSIIYRPSHQ
jgi:transcriptional regulator with XRE-family HTH domain